MKVTFDTEARSATIDGKAVDIFGKESFDALADLWVRIGWVRKYSYGFSWMGRPIIQLPDDMVRIQEAIYATKPDVIIETGVAHGGSLIYYASLFEAAGHGRVIGIDIEIRKHNRAAIEAHRMMKRITLVEGSSIDPATVDHVRSLIRPGEKVMVILDSNHLRDHVGAELEAYGPMVSPGCHLLVQDGVMKLVAGMPRTGEDWDWNNPISATHAFLAKHPEFRLAKAARPFDESAETPDCSHHPDGWLVRV
jgi:cephalosporin hydroxylase